MSSKSEGNADMSPGDLENNSQLQKPVRRLLTPFLFSKKVPPIPKQSDRKPLPIFRTNYISRLFYAWLIPLLNVGYKRTLQQEDLFVLPEDLELETVYNKFQVELKKIIVQHQLKHPEAKKNEYPKNALICALLRSMKWQYTFSVLLKLLANVALAFTPLLTKYLVQFVEKKAYDPSLPLNAGIGYAFGVTLLIIVQAILLNQSLLLSNLVGGQSRTILTKALLEKSLVATPETKHKFPNGKIISMMGADLSRIDLALGFSPVAFGFPVPIIIGIIFLIINIGVSSLAGVAVFLLLSALMGIPAKALVKYRYGSNSLTDDRVGLTREILMAMKMIKFYSWEDAYEHMIATIRKEEISFVLKFQIVFATLFSMASSAPAITSSCAFLVLYAVSGHRDAASIFSSLSLFTMLSAQISEVPILLSFCVDGLTALNRMSEFLQTPNADHSNFYDPELIKDSKTAIKVSNATFAWDVFEEIKPVEEENNNENEKKVEKKSSSSKKKEKEPEPELKHSFAEVLKDVSFEVKKGEFIVITGSIGSGKSSLLSAIFGLMTKSQGSIGINGSMVFCSSPWVQNTTVRENILFGSNYEAQLYYDTCESCSLFPDFESFKAGDFTEIGERGVTLSGGQKARLNLARAVYSNKDIYLLDDVLSAVDANVGKHITDNCILGLLSKKTRVLATHQLSLIGKADRILFLNSKGEIDFGREDELITRNKEFVDLMEHNHKQEEEKAKKEIGINEIEEIKQIDETGYIIHEFPPEDHMISRDEERAIDSIPLSTYNVYFKSGRGIFGFMSVPLLFTVIALGVFTSLFTNVWLSFWIEDKFKHMKDGVYIGLYILFTFFQLVLFATEFSIFGYITTKASEVLNLRAVKSILHTPMSYIDTTPIGRIINRFSKDTNSLDNEIGIQMKVFVHLVAQCIGILILAIIYIPWFAIAIPFLLVIVISVTNYYQASAREVKRLEAINRSFILNNFNEVLNGMPTIKAYNSQSRFSRKNTKYSDSMNEVYFVVNANQRWISVCLNVIAGFIALIISLLIVTGAFNISPSSAGLLTSYIIDLAQLLSSILRTYSETENEMNSVERVCHYAYELEQEAPFLISETTPPPEWPQNGAISLKNVDLRYREGLPLILKNLSFEVEAGSKIGICGRTGAGKSSLMTALFRITELSGGSIEIDGIDISKLGLHQLRSKLSIIPQDPVLFKGTVRKNLDPFNEHSDEKLWDSLRRSGLISQESLEIVRAETGDYSKFHLLSQVEDEGSNFSLGERQLIALARALVRNSKILIMDEATSSVDYETDSKIQNTIATEFKDCTVLCIAHRLKTIIHHDKILVLEKGELEEFGNPIELFRNGGIFSKMCEISGLNEKDFH